MTSRARVLEQDISDTQIGAAEPSSSTAMLCQDAPAGDELLWEWELED
jgi:hypothetical protein